MAKYKVFDGHNDTLLKLEMNNCSSQSQEFFDGNNQCHIDYPKAQKGGLVGGFFAMWVPTIPSGVSLTDFVFSYESAGDELAQPAAMEITNKMMARAVRMEKDTKHRIKIVRQASDIKSADKNDQTAILLHIEGAEAIGPNLNELEVLYAAGLRSIGPVWSRKNIFADGVPIGQSGSPNTGEGLTDIGKALVRACNDMGVMLDMSHINEKGFWDVVGLSDAPIVATHSNVHAICPSARNLTDKQLTAIAESNGVVGLNYHCAFLRPDLSRDPNTPLTLMIEHLAYLVDKLGEDGVALGSDFDGAIMPAEITNAAGLPNLTKAMEEAQFGETLIQKICFDNWHNLLERTLKPAVT